MGVPRLMGCKEKEKKEKEGKEWRRKKEEKKVRAENLKKQVLVCGFGWRREKGTNQGRQAGRQVVSTLGRKQKSKK